MSTETIIPFQISAEYDGTNDVLFIRLGEDRSANRAFEDGNGVVQRFRDGTLIGLTFVDFKERHLGKAIDDAS